MRRGRRLNQCREKTQTFPYNRNGFSSGVTGHGEGCLQGCLLHTSLSFSSSCVRLCHSHLLRLSFSFILFILFIVSFSGTACPLRGSLFLSLSQMFFLLLRVFLSPLSLSPSLLQSLHFSFKHLLPLSFSHTHASRSQFDGSGSSSPPPPTYHRVYYICHHLLLA